MFKKLRNRLILINFGVTTFVIVTIFTTIYLISTHSTESRVRRTDEKVTIDVWGEEIDGDANGIPDEFDKIFDQNMKQEKESAAQNLLVTLIMSGVAIEIVVILVSYFMAEEAIKPVKETYEAQKVFIANASHEIKTPLAAISANLEAADIHGNKWIDNVELETQKLTKLNTELLNLARTDLNNNVTLEEVDLKAVTLKIVDSFEPRLNGKKLKREIKVERPVKINLKDYEQILSILMDNAVKYSDKSIKVKLTEHSLSVSNDGKKIPSSDLSRVFDRFYQVDKSADGVGLGLSIAASLARRNHYKLFVRSMKLTTFTLMF